MTNDAGNRGERMMSAKRRAGVVGFLLLAACASSIAASGEPHQAAGVHAASSIVEQWVTTEKIPGAVLLISRRGEVVHLGAYGWARLNEYRQGQYGASAAGESRPEALSRRQQPVPMRTDTAFDLASVTKVMATTFATMLLVDDGLLDVDAPVDTYLPDFPEAAITVRHLLTHRSGLHPWKPIYYHARSAEEAYRYIRDLPPAAEAGSARRYSDLGFMLLGRIVEQTAGQSLDAFLRDRLFDPLGLDATGYRPRPPESTAARAPASAGRFASTSHGNPYEHRMVHDADFGYRIEGNPDAWDEWRRYTLEGEANDGNAFHAFRGVAGHAGLFSNASELQALLQLLLNRGELDGRRMLRAETVEAFLTPDTDGQALGWQAPANTPAGSFAHSGFTGTWVLGVPEQDLGVVLLTNRQNLGVDADGRYPDVGELQREVTRALIGS